MPPMQVLEFNPKVSGEQYIILCRGLKTDFDNAEHFWLKARQKREWWDVWGDGGGLGNEYENYRLLATDSVKADEPLQYVSLSENEFYELINQYPCFEKLAQPLSQILGLDELRPCYVVGAYARAKWNSVMAMAEFKDEFAAFHWHTTA